MQRRLVRGVGVVVLASLIAACGGGGGGAASSAVAPPPPTTDPSPDPPADPPAVPGSSSVAEDLAAVLEGLDFGGALDAATKAIALRNPEDVIAAGLGAFSSPESVGLSDVSVAYRLDTFAMWQVIRNYLDEVDRAALSAPEQLSFDIYSWQVDASLAQRRFLQFDDQASYFLTSVLRQTERFFSDLHPRATQQDAEEYLVRLALVDDKIDQVIDNLEYAEQRGVIEPSITLGFSISVHRSTINSGLGASPYFGPYRTALNDIPGLDEAYRGDWQTRARALVENEVHPAYERLIEKLTTQQNRAPADVGVGQFSGGQDYYRERLRYHTTTELNAQEIHDLGLNELARIHAELRQRFDVLGYPRDESLRQLMDRAAIDGGFIAAADVQSTYEALIDDAELRMQTLFSRLPETDVVIIGGDTGGFYIRASLDGTRPGAFYAVTSSDQPYFTMPTLAYHEAMPGHHMQIALAQETDLPLFRRTTNFTGYVEGWGLYAERLAGEEGWYANDVYGDVGRLNFEALRATRLVVDTGIHAFDWGWERAVEFFQINVGASRQSAEANIARYSIYTGQATAYMVGMLKLLELRERLRDAKGELFSLPGFHDLVLDNGSMPLELLQRLIDEAASE